MGLNKIGDWNKVRAMVKNMKADMERERKRALENWGDKAVEVAVGHIEAQDLPWKPLKQATLEQKQRAGHGTDTLYSSGQYRDSIKKIIKKDGVFAGIPHGSRTKDKGNDLVMIAAVHEFGAMGIGIEARPLWIPTMQEVMKWSKVNNNPAKKVVKHWNSKYGKSSKQ